MGRHICIIDNDTEFVDLLAEVLAADAECTVRGYVQAPDPDELVAIRPDLVLLDLRLGEIDSDDGWNLLRAIRDRDELRDVPVILCSGDIFALRAYAERVGDDDRVIPLEKPFGVDDLLRAVAWGDRQHGRARRGPVAHGSSAARQPASADP